jgi:hypothetical protein
MSALALYLKLEAQAFALLARAASPALAGTIGVLAVYVLMAWLEEGAVA